MKSKNIFFNLILPKKIKNLIPLLFITAFSACSQGIFGGSVLESFSGISKITVLSPQKVEIAWNTSSRCLEYRVYQRTSSSESADSISSAVPPVRLEQPNIQPDRQYTFSVGCVEDGLITGVTKTMSVTTWSKFNGDLTASFDEVSAGVSTLKLSWSYVKDAPVLYKVFASESLIPNDLNTWRITSQDQPICQTFNQELRIGMGGDCDPPSLVPGRIYNFKVLAQYLDQTTSEDILGKGVTVTLPPAFPLPNCQLTRQGLGPTNQFSYLFLRCEPSQVDGCPGGAIQARAFQAVNNSPAAISETLLNVNSSTALRIEPVTDITSPAERTVSALEVRYSCVRPGFATQHATVRYDGSKVSLPTPNMKYFGRINKATGELAGSAPGYFGGASQAIGDYNCNGHPDLAVGLPNLSYTKSPYFSRNPNTGAVKIYYDYNLPNQSEQNTQIISFRDLNSGTELGKKLASGNINRDVFTDNGKVYSCDDLIIGGNPGGNLGVLVFFGNRQRFPQPLDLSGVSINEPTCSGDLINAVCAPVRLQANNRTYFKNGDTLSESRTANIHADFGASIAYIRDYDADGYGDIAIGAPGAAYPGYVFGGTGIRSTTPTLQRPLVGNTGAVFVFFGGPSGIQTKNLGTFPDGSTPINSPYMPIYPPIPLAGMAFGASISTGGEIDGALPVPVEIESGKVVLAEGNDFLVGAPGFSYSANTTDLGLVKQTTWDIGPNEDKVDPIVTCSGADPCGDELYRTNKVTAPIDGGYMGAQWAAGQPVPTSANATLRASSGIVFAYLGRHSRVTYSLKIDGERNLLPFKGKYNGEGIGDFSFFDWISKNFRQRQNGSGVLKIDGGITLGMAPVKAFYNCGTRGAPELLYGNYYNHISCAAGRNNFKTITPPVVNSSGIQESFSGFGGKVELAASMERNSIAMFYLQQDGERDPEFNFLDNTLYTHQQGLIHERVRGVPLWEAGLPGLNVNGTLSDEANLKICNTYNDKFRTVCKTSANTTFKLARSAVRESYDSWKGIFEDANGLPQTPTLTQNAKTLASDINRDGYADPIITSSNGIWTFFGNAYADFYYANQYGVTGSCIVNRTVKNQTDLASGLATQPFETFTSSDKSGGDRTPGVQLLDEGAISSAKQIYAPEYPNYLMPNTGEYIWKRWLGDSTSTPLANPIVYLPYGAVNRPGGAGSSCQPQKIFNANSVSSIAVADVNNDGLMDVLAGFPNEANERGNARLYFSTSSGLGLMPEVQFIDGATTGSKSGTTVAASHWRGLASNFDDNPTESIRRDIMVGAPSHTLENIPAAGVVHHYATHGNSVMNTIRAANGEVTTFQENSNISTELQIQFTKIIGDINGDGFADTISPYKRFTTVGNIEYDMVIFFGSSLGPITTSYCLEKVSKLKSISGQSLSSSDCEATTVTRTAKFEETTFRLPYKVLKPTTMDPAWVLSAFPAGDVNGDGKDDVVFVENAALNIGKRLSLFFGSDDGLRSGDPASGASSNLYPQTVLTGYSIYTSGPGMEGSATSNPPIVNGDFNGDGYEDLAFGFFANSPNVGEVDGGTVIPTEWNCKIGGPGGDYVSPDTIAAFCDSNGKSPGFVWNENSPTRVKGANIFGHGAAMVIYGGRFGYQQPSNPVTYNSGICNDFYENCDYDSSYSSLTARPVYKSLNVIVDTGGTSYGIDDTKTACLPSGNSSVCTAVSIIPNPHFENTKNSFFFAQTEFGLSMTVSDTNADGIDDLVIGAPKFSHAAVNQISNNDSSIGSQILGALSGPNAGLDGYMGGFAELPNGIPDYENKGSAFMYYGAKGYGIVAPKAQYYMGNQGLGLTTYNKVPFRIYPRLTEASQFPETERTTDPDLKHEKQRAFGVSIGSGDYNGDGKEDLIIGTAKNTFYVYYGPICNSHNGSMQSNGTKNPDVLNKTYQHRHSSQLIPGSDPSGDDLDGNHKETCVAISFSNANSLVREPASVNPKWAPKILTIPSLADAKALGKSLVSYRPKNGKYTGDINFDVVTGGQKRFTDVVIGTPHYTDPNAAPGVTTGIGVVLFGSELGLYTNIPNYNSFINPNTFEGKNYFFMNPLFLRPHSGDGKVGGFYKHGVSAGDVNGDGTLDLLITTPDFDGTESTNKSSLKSGGFMVFY